MDRREIGPSRKAGTGAAALRPAGDSGAVARPRGWAVALGVATSLLWAWSTAILYQRLHLIQDYSVVVQLSADQQCYTFLALPLVALLAMLICGSVLGVGAAFLAAGGRKGACAAGACLMVFAAVPAMGFVRAAWPDLPGAFLEPIVFAVASGALAARLDLPAFRSDDLTAMARRVPWAGLVAMAAAGLAAWWYLQSVQQYDAYELGFYDFGAYARRVINTWEGRGFLMQEPFLGAFWDHFNPGAALLAPLWGLWPDARLFFAVQAIGLAAPALAVYGLARTFGAGKPAAAAWAAAYLAYPAVGQLNYNFSYGWHPETLAIGSLLAAVLAMARGRRIAALILAVLACSFKEDVFVATIGLCVGFGVIAWLNRRPVAGPAGTGDSARASAGPPATEGVPLPADPISGRLPWKGWLLAAAAFITAIIVIGQFAEFSRFQSTRFSHLGGGTMQIVLSPILRPAAFWGEILQPRSGYYLLALLVPLGLRPLARGWPVLLALAVPLAVILSWHSTGTRCIAFQYLTTFIAILAVAAVRGASRGPADARGNHLLFWGLGAMTTCLVLSTFIGALPWSRETAQPIMESQVNPQAAKAHAEALTAAGRLVDRNASVLATGRLASHLLNVRRLTPIIDAMHYQPQLAREAGPGRRYVEAFDWAALDLREDFQQGKAQTKEVVAQLREAGYKLVFSQDDVVVYRRPQ